MSRKKHAKASPQIAGDREANQQEEEAPMTEDTKAHGQAGEMEAEPEAHEESQEFAQEAIDVEQLQADLTKAAAQREEYLNLAQRVQADFDNFRRRNQNLRAEAFDDGAKAFAATLLPVIDNLERAVEAGKDSTDPALLAGVQMVLRQMLEAFEKRGITAISRLGEKFDPNLENAVMQGAPEEGEPGTVCQVLQKGYQMEGKFVLRHAMVKVVTEN